MVWTKFSPKNSKFETDLQLELKITDLKRVKEKILKRLFILHVMFYFYYCYMFKVFRRIFSFLGITLSWGILSINFPLTFPPPMMREDSNYAHRVDYIRMKVYRNHSSKILIGSIKKVYSRVKMTS